MGSRQQVDPNSRGEGDRVASPPSSRSAGPGLPPMGAGERLRSFKINPSRPSWREGYAVRARGYARVETVPPHRGRTPNHVVIRENRTTKHCAAIIRIFRADANR